MLSFTQTDLYQVLKPTPTELDLPSFLRRASSQRLSRLFYLDEQFLMNMKAMICDTKATSKQLDALLIASVVFDPAHSCIEHSITLFNKSVLNPVFQTLQQIINQNDLFADITVGALSTLQSLLKIIYKTYDLKVHQVAIAGLNALVQVIMKKMDQHVQYSVALKTKIVPVSVALKTLVTCIELFPNSFKQSVAAKQTGQKRDSCTHTLELCLYHIEQSTNCQHPQSLKRCRELCLQLLSKLHMAREKTRQSFADTLMRSITNLIMYVDVTKPRAFDAEDLLKELPQEILIGFAFQSIEGKAAEQGKVTIKDVRDMKMQECM